LIFLVLFASRQKEHKAFHRWTAHRHEKNL